MTRRNVFTRFILPIGAALALVFLWLAAGSAFFLIPLPAPLAIVWVGIVTAAFLWVHGYRPGVRERARRTVRIRPLGRAARWVLLGVVPMLLFHAFFLTLYLRITGVPDPTPNPLEGYLRRPGGWIALALFLGVAVPIIEEFGIRGWIQRRLERQLGARWAILLTAILFAVAHLQLLGLPTRFFAGIFFGYAVWATGSIWSAVILHGAHNLSLLLPAAFAPERPDAPPADPGIAIFVFAAVGLVVSALVLVRLGIRMRQDTVEEQGASAALPPVERAAAEPPRA